MILNYEVFRDDWFAYVWVIAPYGAIGAVSFLGRSSLLVSVLGLVTALWVTAIAILDLFPYFLDRGNNTGQGMATGLIPIIQWYVTGLMIAIALVALGLGRLLRGLNKGR
jgi:hypothetical protein